MESFSFQAHLMAWLLVPAYYTVALLRHFHLARRVRHLWIFTLSGLIGISIIGYELLTVQLHTKAHYLGLFLVVIDACVSLGWAARSLYYFKKLIQLKAQGANLEQIMALQEKFGPLMLWHNARTTLVRAAEAPTTDLLQPAQHEDKDNANNLLRPL